MEKGAVRETEGGSEKERERGKCTRSSDGERKKRGEPREASGRLNNIIGGVLTVPGRPRANSSPLPPAWSLSLVLFSPPALFFSLAASYSPARKLRPRWALTEGPTESRSLRPAPVRDGEASTVRCRTQTKTHEGSGVTSRSLTVTVDGSFCPSLHRSSHPALFSSSATFLRSRSGPPRSFLPHVRLLLPFRMPPMPSRESPTFLLLLLLRQPSSSPLSSLREESTSAKVDRLYPVNQVAS